MSSDIKIKKKYLIEAILSVDDKIDWVDDYFPEVTEMLKGTKFE